MRSAISPWNDGAEIMAPIGSPSELKPHGTETEARSRQFPIDVRDVLPRICVPTLITRREGDVISSKGDAEYLSRHISDAELRELPGEDHVPFYGDVDALVNEIKSFVTARK